MDSAAEPSRRRWLTAGKAIFHLIIVMLVIWGVWRTIEQGLADLRREQAGFERELAATEAELRHLQQAPVVDRPLLERLHLQRRLLLSQRFSLSQISGTWLAVSGLLYSLGMLPSWIFWHQTLVAMGQRPEWLKSLRAFFIGHLGKYVPGKAMVVILRTGLVRSSQVDTTVAATSVFVETLTLMSVGGLLAAAILAALSRDQWQLMLWSLLLMVAAGIPTLPPVFRQLVRFLKVRRANPDIERALQGLNYRLMAFGWILGTIGWILMGLSLWAVMQALPRVPGSSYGLSEMMLMTATVALAVVLGFLSLIPGGFGVREVVVMTLLAGPFGGFIAIIAAVLLRLVWLLSELLISIILYLTPGKQPSEVRV